MEERQRLNPEGSSEFFKEKEVEVRRRVAGFAAERDLEQLPNFFQKKKKKGVINTWNVYIAEQSVKHQFDKGKIEMYNNEYHLSKEDYESFLKLGTNDTRKEFLSQHADDPIDLSDEEKESLLQMYELLKANYEDLRDSKKKQTAAPLQRKVQTALM